MSKSIDIGDVFRRYRIACDGMVMCDVEDWNTIIEYINDLEKRERDIKAGAFYEVGEKLKYEYEGPYNQSDIESFFDDIATKLEQGE